MYRTKKGNVTSKARSKFGSKGNHKGSFPIFDRKSAISALRLRGRRKGKERANIINRAAAYAPEAARKAREADKERGV